MVNHRPFKALVFDLFGVIFEFDTHDRIVPIETGVELLEHCKAHLPHHTDLSLYVLSNVSNSTLELLRAHFPRIFQGVAGITTSQDAISKKPDPEMFHYFLSQHKLAAPECIFIDDSIANIETASLLGFTTIHHIHPTQSKEQLKKLHIIFEPDVA